MKHKQILIVDDDQRTLMILKLYVETLYPDSHVMVAHDGKSALATLRQLNDHRPVDLVLTDYQMPNMNGLALAQAVRKAWPTAHVILMSGLEPTRTMQTKMATLKLAGFLQKPFRLEELRSYLERSPIGATCQC